MVAIFYILYLFFCSHPDAMWERIWTWVCSSGEAALLQCTAVWSLVCEAAYRGQWSVWPVLSSLSLGSLATAHLNRFQPPLGSSSQQQASGLGQWKQVTWPRDSREADKMIIVTRSKYSPLQANKWSKQWIIERPGTAMCDWWLDRMIKYSPSSPLQAN